MKNIHTTLRDRLRLAMKRKGRGALTYVALKSGYSTGYISGLYSDTPRNPTVGAVWAIAEALEVDPLWLLGNGEHEQPQLATKTSNPRRRRAGRTPKPDRRRAGRTPKPDRHCSRCQNKIHRDNKSGICKPCLDLSAERRAASVAAMQKEWVNKEKRQHREAKLVHARAKLKAKRLSHIPEEMHELYLQLTRQNKLKAAEATRIVLDHYNKRIVA